MNTRSHNKIQQRVRVYYLSI